MDHFLQQMDHFLQQMNHCLQQMDHFLQEMDHFLQQTDHFLQEMDHYLQHMDHFLEYLQGRAVTSSIPSPSKAHHSLHHVEERQLCETYQQGSSSLPPPPSCTWHWDFLATCSALSPWECLQHTESVPHVCRANGVPALTTSDRYKAPRLGSHQPASVCTSTHPACWTDHPHLPVWARLLTVYTGQTFSRFTLDRPAHGLHWTDLFTVYTGQTCSRFTPDRPAHGLHWSDVFTVYTGQMCSRFTPDRPVHGLHWSDVYSIYRLCI